MTTYTDDHPCRDNIGDGSGEERNCGSGQVWDEAAGRCRPRCSNTQTWSEQSQSCVPLQAAGNADTNAGTSTNNQDGITYAAAPQVLVSSNEIDANTVEESISRQLGEDNSNYNIGATRVKTLINQGLFFSRDENLLRTATTAVRMNAFIDANREHMKYIDPLRYIIGSFYLPSELISSAAGETPTRQMDSEVMLYNRMMGTMHRETPVLREFADQMLIATAAAAGADDDAAAIYRDIINGSADYSPENVVEALAGASMFSITTMNPAGMPGQVVFGNEGSGIFSYGARMVPIFERTMATVNASSEVMVEVLVAAQEVEEADGTPEQLATVLRRFYTDMMNQIKQRVSIRDMLLTNENGAPISSDDKSLLNNMRKYYPWPIHLEGLAICPSSKIQMLDSRYQPTEENETAPAIVSQLGEETLNVNSPQAWNLQYEAAHHTEHIPSIDFFKALFSDNHPTFNGEVYQAYHNQESRQRKSGKLFGDNLYEFGLYDTQNIGYGLTFRRPDEGDPDPTGRGLEFQKPDRVYMDYVHDVKMPFFEAEVEDIGYSNALTIGFDVVSNFLTENYKNNEDTYSRSERTLPNLYRDYKKGNSLNASCEPIDDKYCLYTSENIEQFAEANRQRKSLYPISVNMRITTDQGGAVTGLIKKTGMDKYIMDLIVRWGEHERMEAVQQMFTSWDTSSDEFKDSVDLAVTEYNHIDLSNYFLWSPNTSPIQGGWDYAGWYPVEFGGHKLFAETIDQKIYKYDTEDNSLSDIIERLVPDRDKPNNDRYFEGQVRNVYSLIPLVPGWGVDFEDFANLPVQRFPMGLFPESKQPTASDGVWTVFAASLNRAIFVEKMLDMTETFSRPFEKILKGQKAYAEPIMYKVDKHRFAIAEDGTEYVEEKPVQTFYFSDSDKVQEIDFIDTQVKYGQKYSYRVYVYNFVVGTSYWYRPLSNPLMRTMFEGNPSSQLAYYRHYLAWQKILNGADIQDYPNWGGGQAWPDVPGANGTYENVRYSELSLEENLGVLVGNPTVGYFGIPFAAQNFDVFTAAEPLIIEAPLFERVLLVKDKPPVPPDVEFVPFKGNHKQIKIMITHNIGEYLLDPVIIEPDDITHIREARKSQKYRKDNKLIFKSDSISEYYEIYRMTKKPYHYSDFAGEKYKTVGARGSGASFIENLQPNRKYYYTFRAGERDLISNPTRVYQVELVSHSDGMFLNVEEYKFEKEPIKFSIPFKQCIHITPSPEHRSLNLFVPEEVTEEQKLEFFRSCPELSNLSLGFQNHEDKVWNKTYKLRITSKHSGRKIDINIGFTQKRHSPPTSENTPGTENIHEDVLQCMNDAQQAGVNVSNELPEQNFPDATDGGNGNEGGTW